MRGPLYPGGLRKGAKARFGAGGRISRALPAVRAVSCRDASLSYVAYMTFSSRLTSLPPRVPPRTAAVPASINIAREVPAARILAVVGAKTDAAARPYVLDGRLGLGLRDVSPLRLARALDAVA